MPNGIDGRGVWLAVGLLLACGCSSTSDLPPTVPVTGKVVYKDAPVAGATVSFLGEKNQRPAVAITAADGTYDLMTLDARGAMAGPYSVVVTKTEGPAEGAEPPSMEEAALTANQPPPPVKALLPAKYADATQTPLKFEVKAGRTNVFDVNLSD